MKRILFEYFSNNGIRLHHFLYEPEENSPFVENPTSYNYYKLILQFSGTTRHRIDGIAYVVSPMELCIIPPNALHSIDVMPPETCETVTFMFTQNLLPTFQDKSIFSVLQNAAAYNYIVPQQYVEKSDIVKLFHNIISECKKRDKYSELQISIYTLSLIKILTEITETHALQLHSLNLPLKTNTLSYLGVQYIKEHLTEDLSVETIAKALHVSASHFRQTFKKELGVTLRHYIFEQKMYYAFRLLSQGESPTAVANKLGYEYYSTFYHHYMERFNTLPKRVFTQVNKQRIFGEETDHPADPPKKK